MVVTWLAGITVARHQWRPVAEAPYLAWRVMWHLAAAGQYPRAAVLIAPVAIPLGLAAGGAAWAGRLRAMESAAGGAGPVSAIAFDRRQWRHQARSARARIAAPGAVPLTTRGGDVLVGSVIRAVGHRARDLARLPSLGCARTRWSSAGPAPARPRCC